MAKPVQTHSQPLTHTCSEGQEPSPWLRETRVRFDHQEMSNFYGRLAPLELPKELFFGDFEEKSCA